MDEPYIRQFRPSSLYNIEDIEDYIPGSFHPVHLGNTYPNGRYRIIHKLGADAFSTVWLARDELKQRYVALKILQAHASEEPDELHIQGHLRHPPKSHPGCNHVSLLLDRLSVRGQNGTHAALVYELAGPSISSMYSHDGVVRGNYRLRGHLARKVAFQTAQALDFVHRSGVVHGDLTTSNILLKLHAIDHLSEDEIHQHFGAPVTEDLFRLTDPEHPDSAPKYVVESMDLGKSEPQFLSGDITIIDFGVSFRPDAPPTDGTGTGTPSGYQAPELFFDGVPSKASDVWALACTLFEIRAGFQLFAGYFGSDDESLERMVKTLANFPDLWHVKWLEEYELDDSLIAGEDTLFSMIQDIGVDDEDELNVDEPDYRVTTDMFEEPHATVPEDETALLEDLLGGLLKWQPDERRPVGWVTAYPWFQFEATKRQQCISSL